MDSCNSLIYAINESIPTLENFGLLNISNREYRETRKMVTQLSFYVSNYKYKVLLYLYIKSSLKKRLNIRYEIKII